jgi:hypothetical protein
MYVFGHLRLLKVRETGAVCGAHFVNTAFIVLEVEELAWARFVHPIFVFIEYQPLAFEFLLAHIQVCGDAFDIGIGESWRHALATVGARKAANFGPYFRIYCFGYGVQSAWRVLFDPAQETMHLFTVITDLLFE